MFIRQILVIGRFRVQCSLLISLVSLVWGGVGLLFMWLVQVNSQVFLVFCQYVMVCGVFVLGKVMLMCWCVFGCCVRMLLSRCWVLFRVCVGCFIVCGVCYSGRLWWNMVMVLVQKVMNSVKLVIRLIQVWSVVNVWSVNELNFIGILLLYLLGVVQQL